MTSLQPVDRPTAGTEQQEPVRPRTVAVVLLAGGLIGWAAAFVLAVEKFRLLTDPFYTPSCSVNATVSCGPVMTSPQAEVFGFPNPLLGIGGFAVVAATGAALLAGARLARWYWAGLQIGVSVAVMFVHWLIVQSLVVIGALCLYCLIVWAVTIPIFWYVTVRNLAAVSPQLPATAQSPVSFLRRYHSSLVIIWLAAVAAFAVTTLGLR